MSIGQKLEKIATQEDLFPELSAEEKEVNKTVAKIVTNADKYFRNATDEEIARLIVDDWCELINCDCQIDRALHWTCDGKCEKRVIDWLKQEVQDAAD